jgi:hypothetical protein
MVSRVCRLGGCAEPVQGRKRYCSPEHRAKAEREQEERYELLHRDERNAARRESRAQGKQAERDEAVIDYTAPGAASRPPQFPGVAKPPTPTGVAEPAISDGRVPHPRDRERKLDMSRISGADRRDLVRAQRMAAREQFGPEESYLSDLSSWDDLMTRSANTNGDGFVSFPPAPGSPALTGRLNPVARYDSLGRPYARARWR